MQSAQMVPEKTISVNEASDLLLQNRLLEEMLNNNQIININDFRQLVKSLNEKTRSK